MAPHELSSIDRLVEEPHRVFVIQLFHRFLLSISRQAASRLETDNTAGHMGTYVD